MLSSTFITIAMVGGSSVKIIQSSAALCMELMVQAALQTSRRMGLCEQRMANERRHHHLPEPTATTTSTTAAVSLSTAANLCTSTSSASRL